MPKRHINQIGSLESLFIRLNELVLANSGEDEFEEIFKLIIAKLWDEGTGKTKRFYPYQDAQETYRQISNLLREAEKAWTGIFPFGAIPLLTAEHLHVCVEALSQHTIRDKGLTVMDSLFEFLVARAAKGAKGQYFTPRHVIELCVRMLNPTEQDTILDPACGSGGFLISTLNFIQDQGKLPKPEDVRNYCKGKLWGFDIDARAVQVAKTLMILAGDGSTNIFQLNSLLKPDLTPLPLFETSKEQAQDNSVLTIEDVSKSKLRHHKGFDIILTNPPFAGEVREQKYLESYALAKGKDRIERDILFLERCIQLLRPGGKLAIILPHNKFAAQALGYVREWLFQKAQILAVVGLGRNTFLPHTHQKASILIAQKKQAGQPLDPNHKIFFAVSELDGKNSKGQLQIRSEASEETSNWLRIDHDFAAIVEAFHDFQNTESLITEA